MPAKVRTAVVTGHHSYDVVNFQDFWKSMPAIDPYIQHIEDFCSSPDNVRDAYDCVAFYMMVGLEISDEMPWYWGKPKSALERLGSSKQGLVFLHHTIWAYQKWTFWDELIGMPGRNIKENGYHFDQKVGVKAVDVTHPVTKGFKDWEMTDETYEMSEPAGDSRVLLNLENPQSMKAGAWVRKHKNSNVFVTALGHDNKAWADKNFGKLIERGVLWSAGKLK
jgi:uncharacterized protein